jgi:hypothetical protein
MECPLYQNERYCLLRNLRETNKNIETLLFGNDEISINENPISSIKFEHILDKHKDSNQWSKLSQLMDCPLPTNNTHIRMPTKIAHTQI